MDLREENEHCVEKKSAQTHTENEKNRRNEKNERKKENEKLTANTVEAKPYSFGRFSFVDFSCLFRNAMLNAIDVFHTVKIEE